MTVNKGYQRETKLLKRDYLTDEYFTYTQLWSYAEQIYHINVLKPNNMLEIGIGNGFVSTFLKQNGITVTTVDINRNLKPDIILSVDKISEYFKNSTFELISCCEVLEHMPFEHFEKIIKDLSKIGKKLFLTLPMHNRQYGIGGYIQIPMFNTWLGAWITLPKYKQLSPFHFWEINNSKVTKKRKIIAILKKYYPNVKTSLFKMHPAHRYFLCSRIK